MRPLRAIGRLVRMVFRRDPSRILTLPRSAFNFQKEVGDGTGSSTVMAPLLWVARTFPEAPPALWQQRDDRQEDQVLDHPLLRLLARPNPHFTGPVLWMATLLDWLVDGNTYWLKLRNGAGRVVELWWAPSWLMEPKGDEAALVTHYEYRPNFEAINLRPEDVVHFRFGIDGDDPRRGRAPLKSVLREVFTDDTAANFTAQLLKNMGVPGLIVSPDQGAAAPTKADADAMKAYLKTAFSGDKTGEPLVMTAPTRIAQFGFSPEQLTLRELRRIPEERVTAVLGVPAIVAGLGAGLDRSTFTNMAEAREAAYESGIIPMQRILGEEIRWQLLGEWERDPFAWRFGFDLAKVRVLQEDLYRQAQRHDLAIRGGWEMVGEGRRALGLDVDEERDSVFLRPLNVAQVPADGGSSAAPTGPGRNGNGGMSAGEIADEVVRAIERAQLTAAPRGGRA